MSAGFLLDTVVVSELRKGARADPAVIVWQQSVSTAPVFLSVISLLEIRLGIRRVTVRDPDFAARLEDWYRERLLPRFARHLMGVDQAVAEEAAAVQAIRTVPPYDALIAATARVRDLTLATRNTADFEGLGVNRINPWETPAV